MQWERSAMRWRSRNGDSRGGRLEGAGLGQAIEDKSERKRKGRC